MARRATGKPGWDRSRFAGQTEEGINQSISQAQRQLLRQFLGRGPRGAHERQHDFAVPDGLTRDTLEKYGELAVRAIETGRDPQGVQAVRLDLIQQALSIQHS